MRSVSHVILDGVRYVCITEASGTVDRSVTTLWRWSEAGAVRSVRRTFGKKEYHLISIEDAKMLASLTSEETLAQGIRRVPAEVEAYLVAYRERMQDQTKPAENHRELYDDYDVQTILDTMDTLPVVEQARLLGRTFQAMQSERTRVRKLEAEAVA